MSNINDDQPNLTFSQRYGYEQLPEMMRIDHLSDDIRKDIWGVIEYMLARLGDHVEENMREFMNASPHPTMKYEDIESWGDQVRAIEYYQTGFIRGILRDLLRKSRSDIPLHINSLKELISNFIYKEKVHKVLSLLELLLSRDVAVSAKHIFEEAADKIRKDFKFYKAAYCLELEGDLYKFFPIEHFSQCDDVLDAINTMHKNDLTDALTHCNNARKNINETKYGASIKESIDMIESAARNIRPDLDSKGLGDIISKLIRSKFFKHAAFGEAIKKFYGYAGGEKGIRHSGLPDNIGPHEAILIFVVSTAFSNYLINRNKEMNDDECSD